MWVLNFLPNWLFYAILLLGILGFAATYLLRYIPVPGIYIYKTPIQLSSIVAIAIGTFMSGAIHDNEAWLARVRELEAKVEIAEKQSQEATAQIDARLEEQSTKVNEKTVVIKQFIDREIVKYDATCNIPKELISIVNEAAKQ